jgi:asparagine synthetase B (glutamine-hydrolysing)
MCGILLYLATFSKLDAKLLLSLHSGVSKRGPDQATNNAFLMVPKYLLEESSTAFAVIYASVLHIQGESAVQQPYLVPNGDILGEAGHLILS